MQLLQDTKPNDLERAIQNLCDGDSTTRSEYVSIETIEYLHNTLESILA